MAQPGPAQPSLFVSSHAHSLANHPRGAFTRKDGDTLVKRAGYFQDLTASHTFQVVPDWSDPAWDGTYDRICTGDEYLQKDRPEGDAMTNSRPAIRRADRLRNPTEYARRFGVSYQKPGFIWGHSGLTPTEPVFQLGSYTFEDNEESDSLQRALFDYTSSELVLQGAYNPRLVIPAHDLNEPVHTLLDRSRWDQRFEADLMSASILDWPGVFDVRYGAELDGIGGAYDALNNQRVWDAIEPGTPKLCPPSTLLSYAVLQTFRRLQHRELTRP